MGRHKALWRRGDLLASPGEYDALPEPAMDYIVQNILDGYICVELVEVNDIDETMRGWWSA